jgi:hypothetical protein
MDQKLLTASAIAGAVMGVLSGIPLVGGLLTCVLCAPGWGAGLLGVFLYKRNSSALSVTNNQGVLIGLLAGLVTGVLGGILGLVLGGGMEGQTAQIEQALQQLDPAQQAQFREMLTLAASPGFGAATVCINAGLFGLFGIIGGLIGAATIGKPAQA